MGRVLTADEGSFYISKRFSWQKTVKDFFDAYHNLCERKQVTPMYQEDALSSAIKVPYASIDTINLLHYATTKRLRQFQDRRISPFDKLPSYPTIGDLVSLNKEKGHDKDITTFLDQVVIIDEELHEYVRLLDELVEAYRQRIEAFALAMDDSGSDRMARSSYRKSRKRINKVLHPYIVRLKSIGALPSWWQYSFKELPLTVEGASFISIRSLSADGPIYWASDTLPTKTVRRAQVRKSERAKKKEERLIAKNKRLDEKDRRKVERLLAKEWGSKKPEKKKGAIGFDLSRPSLWERFDDWIAKIGLWFEFEMDDISSWVMSAWIWLVVLYLAVAIVIIWVTEGFFTALLSGVLLCIVIGVLARVLEVVAAFISLIVKDLTYFILWVLRYVFYRGWTFLLTLLALGVVMAIVFLRA